MIPDLRHDTAVAVHALQQIVTALVAARPDADALRARIAAQGCRLILDEGAGLLVFGTFADDGAPAWIDSVRCDPHDPSTFGKTPAQLADMGRAN